MRFEIIDPTTGQTVLWIGHEDLAEDFCIRHPGYDYIPQPLDADLVWSVSA